MRLNPKEITSMLAAVNRILINISHELYLHGSRVDDQKRGGDIDLLLLCKVAEIKKVKSLQRSLIMQMMKSLPEERRIDLTIAPLESTKQSEFVRSILPAAVRLGTPPGKK